MSSSRTSDVLAYGRERLPVRIVLPAAIFLAMAAQVASMKTSLSAIIIDLALASLLVIQFRLWDDLCDLFRDRVEHPDRVLSRLSSHLHFSALVIVLFAVNAALIHWLKSPLMVIVFVLLNVFFMLWYRLLRRWWIDSLGSWHIVLLKYPVFVLLLSDDRSTPCAVPLGLSMAVVYLCFCVFEILDDDRIGRLATATKFLAIETIALVVVSMMIVDDVRRTTGAFTAVSIAVSLTAAAVLIFLFYRHWTRAGRRRVTSDVTSSHIPRLHYAVFVAGFCLLLHYAIRLGR